MAEAFVYNDDLALSEAQQTGLKDRYPNTWFALGQPGAGELFVVVDGEAKKAKQSFRRSGYLAISLATGALSLAAVELALIEPAVEHGDLPKWIAGVVAVLASLSGLLSVLIGWMGIGAAGRKRKWMETRLLAERMRQWQWQYFVANVREIIAARELSSTSLEFRKARASAFSQFHEEYSKQLSARLNDFFGEGRDFLTHIWIHPNWARMAQDAERHFSRSPPTAEQAAVQKELFEAYRDQRFKGQIDYVSYLLGDGPFTTHPTVQKRRLHSGGQLFVIAIVGLHVLVIAGVFSDVAALKSPVIYVLTIVAALLALAVRAIDDGLRPTEHIIRLRGYLSEIVAAQMRFDEGDAAEKVAAMRSLEEAAGREMIEFLKSTKAARYVM